MQLGFNHRGPSHCTASHRTGIACHAAASQTMSLIVFLHNLFVIILCLCLSYCTHTHLFTVGVEWVVYICGSINLNVPRDVTMEGTRNVIFYHVSFLPPANEVCEGYVFTSICLSTGRRCLPHCMLGYTPPGQTPPGQTPPWADTPLGRHPLCSAC